MERGQVESLSNGTLKLRAFHSSFHKVEGFKLSSTRGTGLLVTSEKPVWLVENPLDIQFENVGGSQVMVLRVKRTASRPWPGAIKLISLSLILGDPSVVA